MTRAFARKDFLNLVGGTGILTVLGCASEDPLPDPTGGTGGMAGSAGSSGASGTAGGGTAGTTGGSAGMSGSAGKGGTSGASGAGGAQGGAAGSQAGGAGAGQGGAGSGAGGAGSGGGGAGSGGASGGGQGGSAGSQAGGGAGGTQAGAAGGGQGGSGGGGDACMDAIEAEISLNHEAPHALSVPMADIMAGLTKVYNAQGASSHPHYVELTAEDFATLRAGGTVKKVSCNGGDHEYVLSCGTATETAGNPMCDMADNCAGTMNMLCPDPM